MYETGSHQTDRQTERERERERRSGWELRGQGRLSQWRNVGTGQILCARRHEVKHRATCVVLTITDTAM